MKLFDWIWSKPKKEQPEWTIERCGWEASAKAYNKAHGLEEGEI